MLVMKKLIIGLQGGSGFLGGFLANLLVKKGHSVRISTREENNSRKLWVLPNTKIAKVDMNRQEQIDRFFEGCDCVVNLVGILNERKDNGKGFTYVHVELTSRLIKACKTNGISHLLQVSSLGADPSSESFYQSSKGHAEKLLKSEESPKFRTSIVQPSVIFGPNDKFTNRFAKLLSITRGILPLACPKSKLQPVYVGDVAQAVINIIENDSLAGQVYELGGPEIYSLKEIVEYIGEVSGINTRIIPLNNLLSALQAQTLEFFPGKPFSKDNLRALKKDSVCKRVDSLDTLRIRPTRMSEILPSYLGEKNIKGRYSEYRNLAGR